MKKFLGALFCTLLLQSCGDRDPFAKRDPEAPAGSAPAPVVEPADSKAGDEIEGPRKNPRIRSANKDEFEKVIEILDTVEAVMLKPEVTPEEIEREIDAATLHLKNVKFVIPDTAIENLISIHALNRPQMSENLVTKTDDKRALILLDYQTWYTGTHLASQEVSLDLEKVSGLDKISLVTAEALAQVAPLEICEDTFEKCTQQPANYKGKVGLAIRGVKSFKLGLPGALQASGNKVATYTKFRFGYLDIGRLEICTAYRKVLEEIENALEKPAVTVTDLKVLKRKFKEHYNALED